MNKINDEFKKDYDDFDKWDLFLANLFVIILVIGLLVAGIVIIKMAN